MAWDGLVDCALAERVDAVLLAGDVVDQDNRYFEAYGPLGRGVARLKEAGIAVVAVAGNHDHHTLHEVAAQVGQGHLKVLGRGGRWERWTLRDAAGVARLHVDGWSFPASRHPDDPTTGYDLPDPDDGVPVVGLLHADLDSTETRYAPVPTASLARVQVSAWVLGHVHRPALRQAPGRAPILYPGSLLALDPAEIGQHGATLLELWPDRAPAFRPIPLSRVRYERVHVDVEGVADGDALRGRVAAALSRRLDEVVDEGVGPLEVVSCRVRLTGRSSLGPRIAALDEAIRALDLSDRQGVRLVVERVDADIRPALDLEDLARGSDAPALLARLILASDGVLDDDPDARPADAPELMARAERAAAAVAGRPHFAGLEPPGSDDAGSDDAGIDADEAATGPPTAVALRRQAVRLLDELMRRKEAV